MTSWDEPFQEHLLPSLGTFAEVLGSALDGPALVQLPFGGKVERNEQMQDPTSWKIAERLKNITDKVSWAK